MVSYIEPLRGEPEKLQTQRPYCGAFGYANSGALQNQGSISVNINGLDRLHRLIVLKA